jgi:hypothetical protein
MIFALVPKNSIYYEYQSKYIYVTSTEIIFYFSLIKKI